MTKYYKLRDMPYYQTKVSAENTRAAIQSLLEKYEIFDHQWTKFGGVENIKFIISTVRQQQE